jgi:hypothetical protein
VFSRGEQGFFYLRDFMEHAHVLSVPAEVFAEHLYHVLCCNPVQVQRDPVSEGELTDED